MTLAKNCNQHVAGSGKLGALLILASMASVSQAASLTEQQMLEQEANERIAEFSQTLKGQLQAAIKQGGLPNAVSVCKSVAPAITAQNSKQGWTLARTSLRVRNSDNTPDAWELAQLQKFEAIQSSGQSSVDKLIVASEYIVNGDNTEFRYMKAIPTQELCLGCHGSNINPELSALINTTYPDDKAINFALGDIRGAFSLQKVISDPVSPMTAKP